jgi:hypothetical protein
MGRPGGKPRGWGQGENWRWNIDHHDAPKMTTVQVIEPGKDETEERKRKRVPVGFVPPAPERRKPSPEDGS